MSYRGRALVINNLVAAALWHKLTILPPPRGLLPNVQKVLVDTFWSGQHWLKAAVLYLPLQEGGQGLIDLESRVAAFRLQAVQRLLYHSDVCWRGPACCLLRYYGGLGLDRQLFLLQPDNLYVTRCSGFYGSVLKAWKLLQVSRDWEGVPGRWVLDEPLFGNPLVPLGSAFSPALQRRFIEAGICRLVHLRNADGVGWKPAQALAQQLGMHSVRTLESLMSNVTDALPVSVREELDGLYTHPGQGGDQTFPELRVSASLGDWQEREGHLLSFTSPHMSSFEDASKKALYVTCIKVRHLQALREVKQHKW